MTDPILRPWRPTDAEALRDACRAAPDLHTQLGDPLPDTLARAQNRIEQVLVVDDRRRSWAIVLAGIAVGNVGLAEIEWRHETAWVSYWLSIPSRGHGYATRAVATVADYAFGEGLFRLELGHRLNNPASCEVAARAGFRPEGVERQKLRYGSERFDVELHARLATDRSPKLDALRIE